MARWILAAAILWPVLLGAAWGQHAMSRPRPWSALVYLAASRVCHQKPQRSFSTAGVQWPVCGRCSGVYLGGALMALWWSTTGPRRRVLSVRDLLLASAPTAASLLAEWGGLPVGNGWRFVTALPAGVAAIAAVMRAASHSELPIIDRVD